MKIQWYGVVDLEATTSNDGSFPREEMETIEIGAVWVNAETLELGETFQTLVRPVRRPILHPFCTELTHITQAMVDAAPLFPQAWAEFRKAWDNYPGAVFCSWGGYDKKQLLQDCGYHRLSYDLPEHINLKAAFSERQKLKKQLGMAQALEKCGLPLVGTHHRGLDDAVNIAKLLPWCVGPLTL